MFFVDSMSRIYTSESTKRSPLDISINTRACLKKEEELEERGKTKKEKKKLKVVIRRLLENDIAVGRRAGRVLKEGKKR